MKPLHPFARSFFIHSAITAFCLETSIVDCGFVLKSVNVVVGGFVLELLPAAVVGGFVLEMVNVEAGGFVRLIWKVSRGLVLWNMGCVVVGGFDPGISPCVAAGGFVLESVVAGVRGFVLESVVTGVRGFVLEIEGHHVRSERGHHVVTDPTRLRQRPQAAHRPVDLFE